MSTNCIPFETSKNSILAKAQVIAELEKMVVERLCGRQPWPADPETLRVISSKLVQMGLNERTSADTEQATPLGKELNVDLFKVFIGGIWDPWEVPGILLDHGLIDVSEFQIILDRLEDCLDKGEVGDAVLLPFVKRAHYDYQIAKKNEFDKAFNDLVRWGLLYDCGEKEWSPRTGRHEILWAWSDRCNCGYDHDECSDRDCPCKRETDLRSLN